MGILAFNYTCVDCGKEHASYFNDIKQCYFCESTNITCINIKDKKIDRFSDLGREMYGEYKYIKKTEVK